MSRNADLSAVLDGQRIRQDSDEMKELQVHRAEVEALIREAFPGADITIRYGGSKAKGTMILESYDLDIIVYTDHEEKALGETLAEIYANVRGALSEVYHVEPKNAALRLYSKSNVGAGDRLHIDVVPGRFVDDKRRDAFIYQNEGEKNRLKTNLDLHIEHIRGSGVTDALKLLKLIRVRHGLTLKQFALDLLGVKLMEGTQGDSLDNQLTHVLASVCDADEAIAIEDPANPGGNDLSGLLNGAVWADFRAVAYKMLTEAEDAGWPAAFGEAEAFESPKVAVITAAAEAVDEPTKPWTA